MKQLLLILLVGLAGCKSAPEAAIAESPAEPATELPASPTIIADADAERRSTPDGKAQIIKLAQGENAFLGKLEMEGGGKVPLHRDATEEYIYVLEGTGVMTIDGKAYDVGPNTAIYMPANAEVSFEGGPEKLVALQVFAGPEPARKYDAWKSR